MLHTQNINHFYMFVETKHRWPMKCIMITLLLILCMNIKPQVDSKCVWRYFLRINVWNLFNLSHKMYLFQWGEEFITAMILNHPRLNCLLLMLIGYWPALDQNGISANNVGSSIWNCVWYITRIPFHLIKMTLQIRYHNTNTFRL